MDFLLPLMNAVAQGLRLLNTKESRKYLDEVLSLKQEYLNEILKPLENQSDELIIRIQSRMLILNEAYLQFKPEASDS